MYGVHLEKKTYQPSFFLWIWPFMDCSEISFSPFSSDSCTLLYTQSHTQTLIFSFSVPLASAESGLVRDQSNRQRADSTRSFSLQQKGASVDKKSI